METNGRVVRARRIRGSITELPIIEDSTQLCDFNDYDAGALMKETSRLEINHKKRNT
jgi:hypothetical protein